MDNPLISIIIPTYNRGHLILETISSLRLQTVDDWECIIVDDGSTDDTQDIIKEVLENDTRVKFFKRPDTLVKGAPSCRNYGFSISRGSYIKFLDSDDLLCEGALKHTLKLLENDSSLDFVSSQWTYFDKAGASRKNYVYKNPSGNRIKAYVLQSHYFITSAPLWRVSFLKDKKLFDERLKRGQEADFNFRRLLENPKYKILPDFLVNIREGHDSITQKTIRDKTYKLSNLLYFCRVMDHLYSNQDDFDREILEYQLYRVLTTYYEVSSIEKSKPFYNKIKSYFDMPILSVKLRIRFQVGLFLVRYFSKGYRLIYKPSFDYRTEAFIEI